MLDFLLAMVSSWRVVLMAAALLAPASSGSAAASASTPMVTTAVVNGVGGQAALCQNSSLRRGFHWPADTEALGSAPAPSAEACAEACCGNPRCSHWVWTAHEPPAVGHQLCLVSFSFSFSFSLSLSLSLSDSSSASGGQPMLLAEEWRLQPAGSTAKRE